MELFYVLSHWNPLKYADYLPAVAQSKTVGVVGMGPAGMATSWGLLHAGYRVVSMDAAPYWPLARAIFFRGFGLSVVWAAKVGPHTS